MVKSKYSKTTSLAGSIEARISELDDQIAEIDRAAEQARQDWVRTYIEANSYPGMSRDQTEKVQDWARTRGDGEWENYLWLSDRGELATERARLRRQLRMLAGGRQMRWRV